MQHGFPYFLAIVRYAIGVNLECLEQNIFFGIHNAQQVFQALAIMVCGIHMDMDTAGGIDFSPCGADAADAFLKFGQFRIGQFGRDHFHTIPWI